MDKLFFNVSKSLNLAAKAVWQPFIVWFCLFAFVNICVSGSIVRSEENSIKRDFKRSVSVFTTTSEPNRFLPCSPAEVNTTRCLNGGECLKTAHDAHSQTIICKCKNEFSGEKCEDKAIPSINFLVTAELMVGIGAGVALLFIVVVFIIVLCLFSIKRHKRDYKPWMEETNYNYKKKTGRLQDQNYP